METVWVQNGEGKRVLASRELLQPWLDAGYKVVDPPKTQAAEVKAPASPTVKAGLTKLVKGEKECLCSGSQLAAFLENGWSRPGEQKEGPKDGGKQHAGGSLDREQRSGTDDQGPDDDKDGVEQPKSPRRRSANGGKRGDD